MTRPTMINSVAYAVLLGATAGTFMLPSGLGPSVALASSPPPAEVRIPGVLRDFKESHPDFEVVPDGGVGHYAASVTATLGADEKPVFNEGGDASGTFDNRIAHWTFNEGTGTTAADELGLNPGTLNDGATWTTGNDGEAIHFDGNNDYVNIPSSPEMQISGDITFAGWFKLDTNFNASSTQTMVIMERFLDTEHDFHIALVGTDYNRSEVPKGTLVYKVENGPTSDYYCYTWTNQRNWVFGRWYHFACTLNSADTSQNKVFIDGVDDTDSVIAAGVGFLDTDYDAPMRIGGKTIDWSGVASDVFFKGTIDDVMIYDRALEESDFVSSAGGYKVLNQWRDGSARPIAPHLMSEIVPGASGTIDRRVSTGNDDAEQRLSDGNMSLGSSDLELPEDGSSTNIVGARFTNITVPAGATIVNAYVQFQVDETSGSAVSVTINGEATDDAAGFSSSSYNISSRTRTTAGVSWSPPAWSSTGDAGPDQRTPDLTTIIQEIVDRPGWSDGNDMALIFTGSGNRTAESYNGSSSGAPLLHIEYSTPGTTPQDACGAALVDSSGSAGVDDNGGITSTDTFNEWFNDTIGLNQSKIHTITLTDDGTGVFEYLDDAFYPIDGKVLGNEGYEHNYHFTYGFAIEFVYDQCTAQFMEFRGGDGTWVFIDGSLVMDLGGMKPGDGQHIALDRLGLVDGQTYELHFFTAQRDSTGSVFRLRTNLVMTPSLEIPMVTDVFD